MKKIIIKYRSAIKKDITQVKKILKLVRGDFFNLIPSTMIVACKGNQVLGCVRLKDLDSKNQELASLAVLPKYQHQGIGHQLIRRIIKQAKLKGVYLLCSRDKESLYSENNFQKVTIKSLPEVMISEYLRVKKLLKNSDIKVIAMTLS